MKTKLLLLALFMSVFSWGQNYVSWDFTTSISSANYSTNITNQTGARSSTISGSPTLSTITINGSGVSGTGANTFHRTTGWPTSSDVTKYLEFSVTSGSGYTFDNISLSLAISAQVSNTGTAARNYTVQYGWGASPTFATATNGSVTNLGTAVSSNTATIPAPGNTTTTKLTIRLVCFGTSSGAGNIQFRTIALTGTGDMISTPTCTDPGLTFGLTTIAKNDTDANFIAIASSGSSGVISYSSNTPGVATVNSSTGEVDVIGPGTAIITATQTANGIYCADTATYSLTVNATSPFITTVGTLTTLSTIYGTASTNTTFTVSAGNLTNNLIITPPSGVEISESSTFATSFNNVSPLSIAPTGGLVSSRTIYVRLAATTPAATYSGNVIVSSTGATPVNVATGSSVVSQKALTINGLIAASKAYDGNTNVSVTGTPTYIGLVLGETFTVSGTVTWAFSTKNVGATVTRTGNYNAPSSNYTVTQPTLSANITAKALIITAPTIATKVYNASAVSGAVTVGSLSGFISPETVTATATGLYADANAAIGKIATVTYVLANGANGGLATNYSLTPGTGTGDITKATPVFTTSTITVSVGGTYALPGANVTSSSNGAFSYTLSTGGFATLTGSTINGISVGSETLTVNQAASTNYNAASATVGVTVASVVYTTNDFKTIAGAALLWGNANHWQRSDGNGGWGNPGADGVPSAARNVYIIGSMSTNGSRTANKIIIESGAVLTISASSTVNTQLLVKTGAILQANALLTINGDFEIEDDATVNFNYPSFSGNSLSTTFWNGTENFHPNSNFVIQRHGSSTSDFFIPFNDDITANAYNGFTACFGNLIFDSTTTTTFPFFGSSSTYNKNLTHKDLIFRSSTSSTNAFRLLGTNGETSSLTTTIGRDLEIESGFNRTLTLTSTGTSTINLTIKGSLFNDSSKIFNLTTNSNGTVTCNVEGDILLANTGILNLAGNGSATINLKGDLLVENGASFASGVSANFNFTGTGNGTTNALTQDIDVANAATASNINFNTNSGAYVKIVNQNFALGTNSTFTVRTGGTLDFGFNGSAALNLVGVTSQIGQTFTAQSGSTLKLTSPYGITTAAASATSGNVQTPVDGRTFNAGAIYHYIGKANAAQIIANSVDQMAGNGLPNAITGKVIVELDTDAIVFKASGNNTIATAGTLEIRKGIVEDYSTNSFGNAASNTGNLTMSGGRYRIYKAGTQPDLSGTYSLTAGVLEFSGSLGKTIRSPKSYQNIEVTGTDVGNSSGNITLNSNGTFTVKTSGIFTINANAITGPTGTQTVTVEGGALFKTGDANGFNGGTNTSLKNDIETITLSENSTVEYSRSGDQTITEFKNTTVSPATGYTNLNISGTGTKTIASSNEILVEDKLKIIPHPTVPANSTVLQIDTNKLLTVRNAIENNTTKSILVQNGANLVQLTNVLNASANVNVGNIQMTRTTRSLDAEDYIYWGSPVTEDVSAQIPSAYDASYMWDVDGSMEGVWNGISSTVPGRGFITRVASGSEGVRNFDFTGKPNNGFVYVDALNWNGGTDETGNTILLANPYPSAIDAADFVSSNTSINGTLYFWTAITPMVDGEYDTDDYATWNLTGFTSPNDLSGSFALEPTGKIGAGQGFFAEMNSDGTIEFNNDMRVRTTGANMQFFRAGSVEKNRIWLKLTNTNGAYRQALIGYIQGATNNIDRLYDGNSITGNEINLYSIQDNKKLAIQGRALPFENTDIVPLGFATTTSGTYAIAIDKLDGLFSEGQEIYLEDLLLNVTHDLNAGSYSFTTASGTIENRFILRYSNAPLNVDSLNTIDNKVTVAVKNKLLKVKSAIENIQSVAIFDLLGRKVFDEKNINSTEFDVQDVVLNQQTLIIKMELATGQVITRKIVF